MKPKVAWLLLVVLYAAFFSWYTSFAGPLTPAEIEHYVQLMSERGRDAAGIEQVRKFMESDSGDDFVMVNVIELREPPRRIAEVGAEETAQEVLDRYMAYMWPALLARACHPVLFGSAAAPALDTWGIDGGERWSQAGMMRYRSRRDMMEIASNPDFQGPHEFKMASMRKTIAFPIDPWGQLGDPRLVLGLLFLVIGMTSQLVFRRRS